jgi:predicted DNA-binding transcriptional regulator
LPKRSNDSRILGFLSLLCWIYEGMGWHGTLREDDVVILHWVGYIHVDSKPQNHLHELFERQIEQLIWS